MVLEIESKDISLSKLNMESSKYTVLYLSPGSWYKDFHRKPLVRAISKHHSVKSVYLIEPPADLFHAPLKNWKRLRHALKCLFSTFREDKNIYVYTPFIFLHQLMAYKFSVIRSINIFIFNMSMRHLLKREGIDKNIIFSVFRPEMVDFTHFHDQMTLIYDCYDEYLLTSHDKKIKNLDILEKELMVKSDFIFTTSEKLLEKALKNNQSSFLLHNAADTELFGKAFLEKNDPPNDIRDIKHPLIGYVGALRDWQDFELLEYLFINNPDMNFVFIGHNHKSGVIKGREFEKYQNVKFLGKKRFEDVPDYLRHLDVAIIPNRMTLFNQNVVPYKLFEYLAAGKKILSTNHNSDLEKYYSDYVETADNKFDFSKKLNEMISNDRINLEKIFEFGQKQSWKGRVEKMFSIISSASSK
jgi:glycosyltransferase involved in cell wall biosynthesis